METLIIIQARMNSKRLPGKVLLNILDKPSIIYQVDRVKKLVDKKIKLLVATTNNKKDDVLCDVLLKNNVPFYRGFENDVLQRFVDCSKKYKPKFIIRLNADCPLICPKVIYDVIEILRNKKDIDYASTILDETFPLGMHVEGIKYEVLLKINKSDLKDEEREHVTPKIYRNPNTFKLFSLKNVKNYSRFRITIDYKEDLEVINKIAKHFLNKDFFCDDITSFLNNNSKISKINSFLMKQQKLD